MEVNDNSGNTKVLLQFHRTFAAKVKSDLTACSQQIHVQHPLFCELDLGITQQYTHLGSLNAGPHKYDQEVESRTGQAKATTKALRGQLFANTGLQRKDRLTGGKALTLSKLIYHSATWGILTIENWKNIEATYQQGLRCIHAETKYAQL